MATKSVLSNKITFVVALICYLSSFSKVVQAASCSLGPLGLFCLQSYTKVDWRGFKRMAMSAESPSAIMNWSDDKRDDWLGQLSALCAPFNQVQDCTQKNGGRRWWNCMDDIQIRQLLEQMAPNTNEISSQTNFPREPSQLRDNFDALTDICDPKLISDFTLYHPCMRTAFNDKNQDSVTFRQQIQEADEGLRNGCMAFGCGGAFTYTNIFVYWVNDHCGLDAADTAFKLMGSSIRLQMMSEKTYCDAASYPRDMSPYVLRPVKKPAETLDRIECNKRGNAPAPAPTPKPAAKPQPPPPPPTTRPKPPARPTGRRPQTTTTKAKTTPKPKKPVVVDSNELESGELEEDGRSPHSMFMEYQLEFLDLSKGHSISKVYKLFNLLTCFMLAFFVLY